MDACTAFEVSKLHSNGPAVTPNDMALLCSRTGEEMMVFGLGEMEMLYVPTMIYILFRR
jgi:hypothetical protein